MSEVSQLEAQLAAGIEAKAKREIALKLYHNPEFKKLILQEYCVDECARYAQASADPALTAEQRADSLAMAQAAGHLRRFLSVVVTKGNQAERLEEELEQSILEARQEETEDQGVDPE